MIHINRFTLPNGLRLVHNEDKNTHMVAINVLYDVGARDEHPERTGFAHLFEHLMFGGSVNIPEYDVPVQKAGGENNAFTTNDYTNYYLILPSQNVEVGFWLESDRMLGLLFSDQSLNVQRQVVIEEFKQRYINQPYGDSSHLIRAQAYKVHPYRWPTIGLNPEHIALASLEEVEDFYYRFYAPNNAILSVTGNISWEETLRLAEKWFSSIPQRKISLRLLSGEPKQQEMRRMEVVRPVSVDRLYLTFHTCARLDEAYHAVDMLSDVLANGRSSRLISQLVNKKSVLSSVNAYITGSLDRGLLQIVATPLPEVSLEQAEKFLWEELDSLKNEDVGQEELEKVKNRYESEQVFRNVNFQNKAMELAYFELLGDARMLNHEVENYRRVSSADLRNVAQDVLSPTNANVIYYAAS